jgi:hypothetical protein
MVAKFIGGERPGGGFETRGEVECAAVYIATEKDVGEH